MNILYKPQIFAIIAMLTTHVSYATNNNYQNILNDPVEEVRAFRTQSHIRGMDIEEVNEIRHLTTGLSNEHLREFRTAIDSLQKDVLRGYINNIKDEYTRTVRWAKFHFGFFGKAKAASFIIAVTAGIAYSASLTPIPCDVQNWLGISSLILGGFSAGGFVLAGKSEVTYKELRDSSAALLGRITHMQTLIDTEEYKRITTTDMHVSPQQPHSLPPKDKEELLEPAKTSHVSFTDIVVENP